jgi:DMSO/TMAO reductase YedYZ molybdopterin-dependent catalytic subunit
MNNGLKKANKIAIITLAIIVAVTVPVYLGMRQNAGIEGSVQIKGAVGNPVSFTYNELETLPPATVQVTLVSSSHSSDNGDFSYTGVPLKTLLEQAQISADATSVYIKAADGYGTTISLEDAQNEKTILAYQKDGEALTPLSSGGEGPVRLIMGADQYAQRWVRGVSAIEIS